MIYCFGEFELDVEQFELRRSGRRVEVEPKVLDLLICLVRSRDRLVSREEVLATLWPDVKVSDASIWRVVLEARRAVRDDTKQTIVTVRGRGFRFGAPVEEREASLHAAPSAPAPADDDEDTLLVGREAIRAAAGARVAQALAGEGGAVWFSGEPGIGKTRMAEDVVRQARLRGMQILSASAHESLSMPSHWLWAEVLRGHGDEAAVDASAVRARLGPVFAGEDVQTDAQRFDLFGALLQYFSEAARNRPLVLLFEDLQWADEPSLRLLEPFARDVQRHAFLIVGTYRDTVQRDVRSRILGALVGQPGSLHLPLRRLPLDDVRRLVEALSGLPAMPSFARAVFERSGGNPLYVRNLLKTEWADRALTQQAGEIASTMDLEEDILESVFRHLDVLSPAARDLLTLASVLGKEFQMVQLGVVSGLAPDELLDRIDEAERAHLLFRADGKYMFTHVLLRDVLYKRQTSAERSARHRMIAERMEAHYGAAADLHVSELAEHLSLSLPDGDSERAIEMAIRAARQSAAFGRARQAARHWHQAARAYAVLARDDSRRVEIQLGLARAWLGAGRLEEARDCFADAATLAHAFGRFEELVEAALGYADLAGSEEARRHALLELARASLSEGTDARAREQRARVETALAERAR